MQQTQTTGIRESFLAVRTTELYQKAILAR